jgi:hypothetical protein
MGFQLDFYVADPDCTLSTRKMNAIYYESLKRGGNSLIGSSDDLTIAVRPLRGSGALARQPERSASRRTADALPRAIGQRDRSRLERRKK